MRLYLTPAAVGYLTQLILAGLISGYVLFLACKPKRPQHMLWLSAFLIGVFLFIATLFLEVSLLPTQRLSIVYCQNTVLALALVCLIQFAYAFPVLAPERRWEARMALLLSGGYALWEAAFAVYRFVLLHRGIVEYRWGWSDTLLLLAFLWGPIAFLRQLSTVEGSGGRRLRVFDPLFHPSTRIALTLRNFALIFLFVAGLSVFDVLRSQYVLTVSIANMGISLGVLVALFAFGLTYINAQPEISSFVVRLAGVALAMILAGLGGVAWVVSPLYIEQYQPWLPVNQTLRFTPNARGGYEVAAVPFIFDFEGGIDLRLQEGTEADRESAIYCSEPLPFAFPFYGKVYSQIFVCNDGTVGLGQPLPYRSYQYRLGSGAPLIMALLTDLHPDISSGAIFVRQEPGRLIATWEQQRAFRHPENEFTFQAILTSDGVFELSYLDVPDSFDYQPNDDPGANPWVIGALPGRATNADPERVTLASVPFSSGPSGVIQDFYLEFRQYLHEFLLPLARLIVIASVLVVAGIPLLIRTNLVQPLNALLHGVRQIQDGDYGVQIPVRYSDEIGFLSRAFNTLAAQLAALIGGLEEGVVARTAELDEANVQLRAEIATREELITDLRAFSHTVAHDLKTPLTLITGYSDLIKDSFTPESEPELQEFLNRISAASVKMIRMIEGILTFSRVREAELQLRPLEMATIVKESVHNLQSLIDQTCACVTFPSQWPSVVGHPQWVEEVWSNYLSNALKYGGRPGEGAPVCVELGWDFCDLQGETVKTKNGSETSFAACPNPVWVRFWVRDYGHGIPIAKQSLLFTPFERLDRSSGGGHGLGLSIVKRMIEKLGGEVGVESLPEEGCRFWFTLMAAEPLSGKDVTAMSEPTVACVDPVLVDRLAQFQTPLLLRLAQAAEDSDLTDLRATIAQVESSDPATAAALDALLYNFDYDAILLLVQTALALKPDFHG